MGAVVLKAQPRFGGYFSVGLGLAYGLQGVVGIDAAADIALGILDLLVDAGNLGGQRARTNQAHDPGNMHGKVRLTRFAVREAKGGKRCRCGLGVPHGFNGGQLHLLVFRRQIARLITQHHHRQRGSETERRSHGHRTLGQMQMAALEQIPGRYTEHKQRSHHITCRDRVHKLGLRNRVGQHGKKVGHFHAHGLRVESCAHGVLHPAVGHQNPQCREVGGDRHHASHHQVLDLGQTIPAKEEQTHKGRFHEESHQPFNSQRGTKNVAHIVAVVAPVHAELEFHHHASRHTHGEVDAKQDAPELGHVAPDGSARHHKNRLHDGDEN